MPLEDNEAWIHSIKAIMVNKDKLGVPRLEKVYDLGNEPNQFGRGDRKPRKRERKERDFGERSFTFSLEFSVIGPSNPG